MGRFLEIPWLRVGAWTGTLKNPTKCLWHLVAHLSVVTYMTDISLNVTLNNQIHLASIHVYPNVCCKRLLKWDSFSECVFVYWLLNVKCNNISVIYVTAHRYAGGLKKLDLRLGSQHHRHLPRFFNMSPRGDAGGLCREYVLRIPSVS